MHRLRLIGKSRKTRKDTRRQKRRDKKKRGSVKKRLRKLREGKKN